MPDLSGLRRVLPILTFVRFQDEGVRYTVRPISDRTWLGSMGRKASQFSAKWGSTLEILGREVDALQGRNVVIEIDVTDSDLKLNGELRANARPSSSAVVVAFESKHGPLLYRCDRFYTQWSDQGPEWQHNVRAIALTLEALRAVDRYGATETGQQYQGFKALPAGWPNDHMTSDVAWTVLREQAARRVAPDALAAMSAGELVKHARRAAHPDHNSGDHTLWNRVDQAASALLVEAR